jgi:hypothetical protein
MKLKYLIQLTLVVRVNSISLKSVKISVKVLLSREKNTTPALVPTAAYVEYFIDCCTVGRLRFCEMLLSVLQ